MELASEVFDMNIISLGLISAVLASWIFHSPASAAEFSKQAFQAEYALSSNLAGKSVHKLSNDGKGHGRSEMISAQSHNVSIIDLGKHQILMLNPKSKTVISLSFRDDDVSVLKAFGQKVGATGKPLGTKTIDGHVCTGTQYSLDGGGSEEIWNGQDIAGNRVYSKVMMPGFGVSEARLQSYSPVAPGADQFSIPPGYIAK